MRLGAPAGLSQPIVPVAQTIVIAAHARPKPRVSNQPRDEGLLHDLRLGFEASPAPMAISAAQPPLNIEQAHAAVCRRAELEYVDRPDPGLVAAGLALRTERPSRVDVVAEPHR